MMLFTKINVWTLIFLCIGKASCNETEAKEDLVQSESKDGTLEIIKQIKKVNNDGSYTVGYEADDGSFKIESRDVLGNIKGTYGYIDDTGKIKRVSYSSTNTSEIIHHVEGDSVVQRIPKLNRTIISSTTGRPFLSTTASSIQNLVKKKHNSASSTTANPSYSRNEDSESKSTTRTAPYNRNEDSESRSTTRTHLVYATTPRSRFLLKSAESSHGKHEGQLPKPEDTDTPTEVPLFRRLAAKHPVADIKPVTEEPELKSNILRRQLPRDNDFDPHQHVHSLQQSLGNDSPDVYSASMTTGTPRPLFTTTYRPVIRLSTTNSPIRRATVRYPKNLQSSAQHKEETTPSAEVEESNEQSPVAEAAPTTVPVVQIPANRAQPETLVAIRHPYQRNTLFVPLSHLQRRLVPFASPRDINDNIQGYVPQLEQYSSEPTSNPAYNQETPRPQYARRLPTPLRPIPVQIDDNGYVREYPQQSSQQKYVAVPIPIPPKYAQEVSSNNIENIEPPVSIRDFQIILQQLELRQRRLERLHELTDPRRNFEHQQKRNFEPNQYYNRYTQNNPNNVVQFVPNPDIQRRRQYESGRQFAYQDHHNQYDDEQFAQSYVPTKRVARLLKNPGEQGSGEEYLPVDVREMLLLKMLQLAINPALPSDSEESGTSTTPVNYFKKDPSRNVEILGEEKESSRRPSRVKRFKEADDLEYTE